MLCLCRVVCPLLRRVSGALGPLNAQAHDSRLADGQVHVPDAQRIGDGLKDSRLPGIQMEEQGQHGAHR